ncbi:MAG: PDZ domain-containing protein [Chitinophagaceae bacterium]|nr:PDZ domain-containing protein [Chitinophagaceae bacterium]
MSDALSSKHIAQWKNPQGGYIHGMHAYLWGDMHWLIKGKNIDGSLIEEGGWQNNRPSPKHPVFRMVENIFEELDTEGEWFFNAGEGMLYYIPSKGIDITKAKVEIVRLKQLIEFSGSKEHPVNNIELKGFVFRHTARTFMENKEPLLRSDWTVFRGGAIFFNGAENCRITDCEFDQVGGNAVFVNKYNRHISIKGCYIHHAGANGVSFVGDPTTVRSPIFRYGNQNFQTMDRTPGPIGDNFPEDCQVEDCLITMTGRDEKQTAPIQISISHKITVTHCSIYDVPRAGINISEGTFGEHIIQDCDIFNTVLETGDHGSFNSWGRDRYWTPDTRETDKEVAKEPGLPYLDMLGPNILRHNRWRCDHGWDIDLDDGSSWYRIYNNLLLNGGLKMREGFDRIATNNIIINNGLHPHVWYLNSGDVFSKNIVFKAYQPAIMDNSIPATGKWGKELDYNFYVGDSSERKKFIKNSCDLNSLNGNPFFIDPTKGDFRVNTNSPALKAGFVNFSMNDFGVVKPSLKAIAKQPKIPQLLSLANNQKGPSHLQYTWMGISLVDPVGDQWSAYGVSYSSGGVALSNVLENSPAYKLGFRSNDLIQDINGSPIPNSTEFKNFFDKNTGVKVYSIVIIRKQQSLHLKINQELPRVN